MTANEQNQISDPLRIRTTSFDSYRVVMPSFSSHVIFKSSKQLLVFCARVRACSWSAPNSTHAWCVAIITTSGRSINTLVIHSIRNQHQQGRHFNFFLGPIFYIFQCHQTIEKMKKQHFICSNLTLFIVPFFLSLFFLFSLFSFFFLFFLLFPWERRLPSPLKWHLWASVTALASAV